MLILGYFVVLSNPGQVRFSGICARVVPDHAMVSHSHAMVIFQFTENVPSRFDHSPLKLSHMISKAIQADDRDMLGRTIRQGRNDVRPLMGYCLLAERRFDMCSAVKGNNGPKNKDPAESLQVFPGLPTRAGA